MANSVRIRFRSFLPGSGFDSNGSPVQRKQEVRGKIQVTTYVHGGESLTPAAVGLANIDWLDIKVDNAIGGSSGGQARTAHYSHVDQEFYILEGALGSGTEIPAGKSPLLSFNAFGDSAHGPEIL